MSDVIRDWIRESAEKQRKTSELAGLLADFNGLDRLSISKMSDSGLAAWQAQFPVGSPHVIFAEQLWKYRLARKSAKFAALIAVCSALVGAILGYIAHGWEGISRERANGEIQKNCAPQVTQKAISPPSSPSAQ